MPAAVLTIDINARLASLEQAFQATRASATKFSLGIIDELKKVNSAADLLKLSFGGIAAGITFEAVKNGLAEIKQLASDGERSVNQLVATLKATGNAAGLTKSDLQGLTEGLRGSTIFDSESIRAAEAALLRFRTVQQDTFRQGLQLVPDLATALRTDLPTAAEALGRALTAPETGMRALRAAGVFLSESQIDLAARLTETGDKAGAQQIILDELRKSIGGLSESDSSGLYGSTKRAERAFNEFKQALGEKTSSQTFTDIQSRLFDTLAEKIRATKAELFSFVESIPSVLTPGTFNPAGLIKFGADRTDANAASAASRTSGGKIGVLGQPTPTSADTAAAAAEAARQQQAQEEAYKREQEGFKRRADNAASYYAFSLAQSKYYISYLAQLNEEGYSRGTVAASDYFDTLRTASTQTQEVEQRNLGKQIYALLQYRDAAGTSAKDAQAAQERALILDKQRESLTFKDSEQQLQINIRERQSIRQLQDEYENLAATLAQARGDTGASARIRFNVEQRDATQRDTSTRDSAIAHFDVPGALQAQQAINQRKALGDITAAQADLTDASRAYQLEVDQLGLSVERVNLAQSTGAITTIDGLNRQSALNAAMVPLLQAQYLEYKNIAATLPGAMGEQAQLEADKMRLKIDQVASSTHLLSDQVRGELTSDFSTFFSDIASGTKKPIDAIRSLGQTIEQQLLKRSGDTIAEQIFGKSGFLGDVPGSIAKLFGENAGPAALGTAATSAAPPIIALGVAATETALALTSIASSSLGKTALPWVSGFDLAGGGDSGDVLGDFIAALPGFDTGTSFVPRDMIAKVHRGEAIVTARNNASGSSNVTKQGDVHNNYYSMPISVPVGTTGKTTNQLAKDIRREFASSQRFG